MRSDPRYRSLQRPRRRQYHLRLRLRGGGRGLSQLSITSSFRFEEGGGGGGGGGKGYEGRREERRLEGVQMHTSLADGVSYAFGRLADGVTDATECI